MCRTRKVPESYSYRRHSFGKFYELINIYKVHTVFRENVKKGTQEEAEEATRPPPLGNSREEGVGTLNHRGITHRPARGKTSFSDSLLASHHSGRPTHIREPPPTRCFPFLLPHNFRQAAVAKDVHRLARLSSGLYDRRSYTRSASPTFAAFSSSPPRQDGAIGLRRSTGECLTGCQQKNTDHTR